jgi:hypothetical protein
MPYPTNADLPPSVRSHLPEHAQESMPSPLMPARLGKRRRRIGLRGGRQAFLRQGREQLDRPSPVISLRAIS